MNGGIYQGGEHSRQYSPKSANDQSLQLLKLNDIIKREKSNRSNNVQQKDKCMHIAKTPKKDGKVEFKDNWLIGN